MNENSPFPTPPMQPPLDRAPRRSGLRRFVFYLALVIVVAGALYFTVLRPYVAEYVAKQADPFSNLDGSKEATTELKEQFADVDAAAKADKATVNKMLARGAGDVGAAGDTVATPCYSVTAPKGFKARVDRDKCLVALEKESDKDAAIYVGVFVESKADFYSNVASSKLEFYEQYFAMKVGYRGHQRVKLNAYPTLAAYTAGATGKRTVYYVIDNKQNVTKTKDTKQLAVAFHIQGLADTDERDFAVRLVAKSFKIVE